MRNLSVLSLSILLLGAVPAAAAPDKPGTAKVISDDIRDTLTAVGAVTKILIRIPRRILDNDVSANRKCLKMQLRGEHGQQVLAVIERLESIQNEIRYRKAVLTQVLRRFNAARSADSQLARRIVNQNGSLVKLLGAFKDLTNSGEKAGLLKIGYRSFFSSREAIRAALSHEDYQLLRVPNCQ